MAGNPQLQGAQASGKFELVTAATYDSGGSLKDVKVAAVAAGESKGVVSALFGGQSNPDLGNERAGAVMFEATLPVRGGVDRQVASDFFVASGVIQFTGPVVQGASLPYTTGATVRFLDATRARGYVTRQTFSDENKTEAAIDVSGRLGIELGAGFSVESAKRTSTGAQYWDGTRWMDRTECEG